VTTVAPQTTVPNITFSSLSGRTVNVSFSNLPGSSSIVFVNQTSGQTAGPPTPESGSGTASITADQSVPEGSYYLLAEDANQQYLAQTIVFTLPNAGALTACAFYDQTVANGGSITAYQAATVPYGQQCVSQTRTCSNGTLSGSYGYTTCSVAAPTVTAVSPIAAINVGNGTALAAVGLPTSVGVTFSDGTTPTYPVTWDGGTPSYNGSIAGTYTFVGVLTLPTGVTNPNNLTASVQVIVAAPLQVAVTFTGSSQVMFEQTAQSMCSSSDYIDSPADAWWDASGLLHMITGSESVYAFSGSSLDTVQKNCGGGSLFQEALNPTYSTTDDHQWLTFVYSPDGTNAYGLVHNEWHEACNTPAQSGSWAGAITIAQSSDGGATFTQPADYQIRVPGVPWSDSWCTAAGQTMPYIGSFGPDSNLILKNGYYYMFFVNVPTVLFVPGLAASVEQCIARSATPAVGSSWQVWTNNGWANALTTNDCKAIFSNPQYDGGFDYTIIGPVVYSTYLDEYVAIVGTAASSLAIRLSPDLMNWSAPTDIPLSPNQPQGAVAYPSFLSNSNDPSVTGRNFENIGQDAWLYYVTLNPANYGEPPRYLMRAPVHFALVIPPATVSATTGNSNLQLANALTALESALKALVAQL
jgi:hypothetical protein